jgi:hypothetical protein
VLLFFVGPAFGQGKRRTEVFSYVSPEQNILVGNCGDFEVWERYTEWGHGVRIYDKDGRTVRQLLNTSFDRTNTYYNASNPDLFLVGSPGEGQNFRIEYEDGIMYMSGLFTKIVIPGYGHILMETGLAAFDLLTGELLRDTGQSQWFDRDFEALCDFLTPKP